jgi:excisionase family DNA binding protein
MLQKEKEFFTVKEFADKLGVHWFTVWRWTAEKRITFRQSKVGGKILIPASELFRLQSPEFLSAI